MKLVAEAIKRCRAGQNLALVTVIECRGSVPRHPGSKMLVAKDGSNFGTIGGGRVEQEVTQIAIRVAKGAAAERVSYDLVRELAMCCGGSMTFYIEPVAPSLVALEEILVRWRAREPALLITRLDGTGKLVDRLGHHGARASGSSKHALVARLENGRFLEPILPPSRVILFGCGHLARAIGPLATSVGFEVAICDDDETGAMERGTDWAKHVIHSFELADVRRDLGTLGDLDFAVILTRDHSIDQRLLEALLPVESLSYLGMIGSRGKVGRFEKRLRAKGLADDASWARLHAPIGLDIGAETPAEIALAVVAELVRVRGRGE